MVFGSLKVGMASSESGAGGRRNIKKIKPVKIEILGFLGLNS
jgi:hypothetical protein